ncbi:UNVERIFIED_CONTAM: 8-hydroxygeraniol dehydrogenase [Sesamum calycinum]|uniref:8-hydroxygeraniol dehydrogenase n=1 Tax=Sesamum calycinum TaxID=2727403 RepID=A0AAW2SWK3_9LAMI
MVADEYFMCSTSMCRHYNLQPVEALWTQQAWRERWGCRSWWRRHLTVKFAKCFGCKVTVISTSANKKNEAMETFGADEFLVRHDQEQMQAHGSLVLVGAPPKLKVPVFPMLQGGKAIVGTTNGGLKQIQDMLELAAKHKILPDVEVVPID